MTKKDYIIFGKLFNRHIEFDSENIDGRHLMDNIIEIFKQDRKACGKNKFDESKFRYFIKHGNLQGYKQ